MTVGELCQRMDSRELTEWIAWHTYYEPFGDSWRQTGLMVAAMLAPYTRRGDTPDPEDFVPVRKDRPQHQSQIDAVLEQMRRDLGQ